MGCREIDICRKEVFIKGKKFYWKGWSVRWRLSAAREKMMEEMGGAMI